MTTDRIWISAVVLALWAVPSVRVAQAQRAFAAAPRVSVVRAHTGPLRLPTTARASGRGTPAHSRSAVSPSTVLGGSGFGPFGEFPGLGFNFGPSNQDWGIQAAIDPATQWRLFEAQRFYRNRGFGTSGFYLFDGGAYYAPTEPAEAEGAPQEQGAPAEAETAGTTSALEQPAPRESMPLADVGQFVLVLRSGRRIDAVAFTRANDHIIYVTADGFRRTLALTDLDPDATIRINEERGTPLEISL